MDARIGKRGEDGSIEAMPTVDILGGAVTFGVAPSITGLLPGFFVVLPLNPNWEVVTPAIQELRAVLAGELGWFENMDVSSPDIVSPATDNDPAFDDIPL